MFVAEPRRIQAAKRVASESAAKQMEIQIAHESERQRQDPTTTRFWGCADLWLCRRLFEQHSSRPWLLLMLQIFRPQLFFRRKRVEMIFAMICFEKIHQLIRVIPLHPITAGTFHSRDWAPFIPAASHQQCADCWTFAGHSGHNGFIVYIIWIIYRRLWWNMMEYGPWTNIDDHGWWYVMVVERWVCALGFPMPSFASLSKSKHRTSHRKRGLGKSQNRGRKMPMPLWRKQGAVMCHWYRCHLHKTVHVGQAGAAKPASCQSNRRSWAAKADVWHTGSYWIILDYNLNTMKRSEMAFAIHWWNSRLCDSVSVFVWFCECFDAKIGGLMIWNDLKWHSQYIDGRHSM